MTIRAEVDGRAVSIRFAEMPDRVHKALSVAIAGLRLKLEARVKEKLSGSVLHVRSGNLRRSIFSDQTETTNAVVGRVAQSADVPYGRIHEYGGKTGPHDIVPVKAQALAFMAGGKLRFAQRVHHPGSVMPERSYLRSSLREMKPEIVAVITAAAVEGMK